VQPSTHAAGVWFVKRVRRWYGIRQGGNSAAISGFLEQDIIGMTIMRNEYTAVVKQEGDWWIGWIAEIPGVNCQEKTFDELKETLRITLKEALEFNRQDAWISGRSLSSITPFHYGVCGYCRVFGCSRTPMQRGEMVCKKSKTMVWNSSRWEFCRD